MTLRQAVALAQQHDEAQMTFVTEREGVLHATGAVRPFNAGDGGFLVTKLHSDDDETWLIRWDQVLSWWFHLEVDVKERAAAT
jgi:hypothetical protein